MEHPATGAARSLGRRWGNAAHAAHAAAATAANADAAPFCCRHTPALDSGAVGRAPQAAVGGNCQLGDCRGLFKEQLTTAAGHMSPAVPDMNESNRSEISVPHSELHLTGYVEL